MELSAALIWISGAVAFPLLASVTVFTVVDAVSSSIYNLALAIAAAALNVLALGSLTLLITLVLRSGFRTKGSRAHPSRLMIIPTACACFGLTAAATTLAELIENRRHTIINGDRLRMTIAIGLCVGAMVAQAVFYSTVAIAVGSNEINERPAQLQRTFTPELLAMSMSQRMLAPAREPTRPDDAQQSTLVNDSTSSLPALHSSLTQAIRPITSKTRLVRTPTTERTQLSHSLRSSIDRLNRGDAFDRWDTSDVDSETRDAVLSGSSRRKGVLEPIPGSRPGSPGRPLEGPFPETSSPSQAPSPTLPEPPTSPYMSRPGTSHSHHAPYMRRNDSRVSVDSTRPSSPAVSEAHIHPLFRTDSPTPPPAHSPNTVILASPKAGQIIAPPPKAFSRMNSRETIRPGGQSPLAHSKPFASEHGSVAGSAPPSRMPTPPIPDFVMDTPR